MLHAAGLKTIDRLAAVRTTECPPAPLVCARATGSRTFLESEAKAGSPARLDLLKKALEFAPSELTDAERSGGLTKLRYMRLRDSHSTSVRFGFRIDGISLSPQRQRLAGSGAALPPAPMRACCTEPQLDAGLAAFFGSCAFGGALRVAFAERLASFRRALERSPWFARRECIGSSLLFVFDGDARSEPAALASAQLRWIDFSKCLALPGAAPPLTHRALWRPGEGSREDGLLLGVDALIDKLRELPATPPPIPHVMPPPSPQHCDPRWQSDGGGGVAPSRAA